jgi:hypothetical protein
MIRFESERSFRITDAPRYQREVPNYIGEDNRTQITTKSAFSRAFQGMAEEENLIRLLGMRSAHLPGNNLYQDWIQFIKNNHPFFGLCFHHRLHPIDVKQRIYIFIASVSLGLFATNSVSYTICFLLRTLMKRFSASTCKLRKAHSSHWKSSRERWRYGHLME